MTVLETPVKKAKKAKAVKAKRVRKEKPVAEVRSRPLLDAAGLKEEEARLRKAYPNIVVGSLCNIGADPGKNPIWAHKRTVEIKCATPGCKNTRRIATSDLHQVEFCEDCTRAQRLERRRNSRKKAAKAAARAKKPK